MESGLKNQGLKCGEDEPLSHERLHRTDLLFKLNLDLLAASLQVDVSLVLLLELLLKSM